MITIKIQGGLGNQMFQYAFGRSRSLDCDIPFNIDTSWCNKPSKYHYPFILDRFKISHINKNISSDNQKSKGQEMVESHYAYDSNLLLQIKGDVVYSGYFQSEDYFKHNRNVLLEDFELKHKNLNSDILTLERKIQGRVSIFVHMRGRERRVGKTREVHGLVSKEFYTKALGMMKNWFPDSQIICFTDDRKYALDSLGGNVDIMLDNEIISDYQAMYLMSKCDHAIVPNSSFSWWGAWLIRNPHKIIITASQWTIDPNFSNPMIVPQGWIRINPYLK